MISILPYLEIIEAYNKKEKLNLHRLEIEYKKAITQALHLQREHYRREIGQWNTFIKKKMHTVQVEYTSSLE